MKSSAQYAATIVAFSLGTLVAPAVAKAQTISFDNLPGANGSPFTSYVEVGFNVTLIAGDLCVAKGAGNPIPDLFDSETCGSSRTGALVSVTKVGGGLFRWLGIDLAAGDGGTASYVFSGRVLGFSQYSQTGTFNTGPAFITLASTNTSVEIDELQFSLLGDPSAPSFNLDNIALGATATTVPEPSSFALMGAGLLSLLATARRRRTRST